MSSPKSEDFSSPCPKTGQYDVFISFRGADTRNGFTANLYDSLVKNKIYTFMDVNLLGEVIKDTLFKVIGTSRMAVVVYSENYASSHWCLRELELIMQHKEEEKIMMIPIFYKVNTDDVKHLTEKTIKYFDDLEKKHGKSTVDKWKKVVTDFGNVSGMPYIDVYGRSERDFIEFATARIMIKLGKRKQSYSTPIDAATDKHKLDENKESTGNQQAHVLDKKENTQALEQTNELYRIVTTGYFQKLEEITGELLNIKPANVIFSVEPKKQCSTSLILSNKTDNYVAFQVKTTKPGLYDSHPNMGILLPRSTCEVIVTMQAQTVLPPDMKCRDKFAIESMNAKKDSSIDDLNDMFKEDSGNAINIECKMKVVYVAPPQLVSSARNIDSDNVAQLSNKGLVQGSERVKSIDLHPTKPWVLIGLDSGNVSIWNYETRAEEKSFKVSNSSLRSSKFVPEKHWIMIGAEDGFVYAFDYNTLVNLKEFKAHEDFIRCVAVHPTLPYLLTTSDDRLVKLWNWENDWACDRKFEGHSDFVMQVAFNPRDSNSFASVSLDGTIKIWSFDSSVAKFTIDAQAQGSNCVEYFIGNNNKLYLLSGYDDYSIRIWDYQSKTHVQTLEGHSKRVITTLVHTKLPIIITGSTDKTIRIWNKNTHRLEHVWHCNLGRVGSIKFIETSDEVVLACDKGMVLISIVEQKQKDSASPQNIKVSQILQLQHTQGEEEYRIYTTGFFQTLEEIRGELLNIKPAKLKFIVEPKKQSSASLILSNKTDNYVAFQVKTTRPQNYTIDPNKGLLLPRSTCEVIVTVKAQNVLPPDMKCNDKFLIQSVKAKNDSSFKDNLYDMFTKGSGNAIDKCMMRAVYVNPPQLVSSVPDNLAQQDNKGLAQGSEQVKSIDLHPKNPWVLLSLDSGSVSIWNYETRAEEKSFKVDDWPVRSAKFVPEKHWIVVGASHGFVRVFDYNTLEKLKEFKAHDDFIECVAVHPTLSYALTSSNDKLVKLWNWENNWAYCEKFEGHSSWVVQVVFDPKDSHSFVSVSLDGTIKIWSFGSSIAKFTINAHAGGWMAGLEWYHVKCVEYFIGNDNKLYLLGGCNNHSVGVWDFESKTLVQALKGHSDSITTIFVHPELPIMLTGSEDKTVRIWNKNTYQLELVWDCAKFGRVWSIRFIKASKEVVIGCDMGMVAVKIVYTGTR